MKKLKVISCIVLALVMLSTSFAFSTIASAADVDKADVAQAVNLQSNIENGVILHACSWSYNDIKDNIPYIAEAGYSAVQTSPVQIPKDMTESTDMAGQWWKLYQPVSFSIPENAKDSWLGSRAELQALCNTAHQYGVKIICDIVSNHLGANSEIQNPRYLATEIQTNESFLWNGGSALGNDTYFHQDFNSANDSNNTTTGIVTGCPDLNTSNTQIQNRVKSLLRQCIDCGVDGFRFDAAKHIETPYDSSGASDYWTNVLGDAKSYASGKGKTLFYYGEVLNSIGMGRSSTNYTQLADGKFRITDNQASATIRKAVTNKNASNNQNVSFGLSGGASHAVIWAESHDTYLGNSDSEETTNISDSDIIKAWALVAARKDATPLYFARTNNMKMGTFSTNTSYKSLPVVEVNKFHNNFVNESEKTGFSGGIAYVARGTKGIVLVNVSGTTATANVSGTGLADGTYTDMVSGNEFTVSGGTVSGQIGETGVAVVTQSSTTPWISADQVSQTFAGDSIVTKITCAHATTSTYQLDNYTPIEFTDSATIRLGKDYNYGDTFTLTLRATDGTNTSTVKYNYKKKKAPDSGVYVILPDSVIEKNNADAIKYNTPSKVWNAPFYCYVYDEQSISAYPKYANAAWPGEEMKHDDALGVYYIQVYDDFCYVKTDANAESAESDHNLVSATKTKVFISDSSKSSGNKSEGKKFPEGNVNTPGFRLQKTSHIYKQLSDAESVAWGTTDMVPGQEGPISATVVGKNGIEEDSSEQQSSATGEPGKTYYFGDANLDDKVDIDDVTVIQQHLVRSARITDALALLLADVTNDGAVTIQDANYIQRKLAEMSNTGRVNEEYVSSSTPTNPTSPTGSTNNEPSSTYTLYLKTRLTWLTAEGADPYVYDKTSGESYKLLEITDEEDAIKVYTANVDNTLSSAMIYRALAPVSNPMTASSEDCYNKIDNLTFSATNNCYTLKSFPDGGAAEGSVGPYSEDDDDSMTIYFTNNNNWAGDIYCYAWFDGPVEIFGAWSGQKMTVYDTDNGQTRYKIDGVPIGCNIIFTNGSAQTSTLAFDGSYDGFYVGANNSVEHYTTGLN